MITTEHNWQTTHTYGYARFDKCERCGQKRCYSWAPGWPGSYKYYDASGETIESPKYGWAGNQPRCA